MCKHVVTRAVIVALTFLVLSFDVAAMTLHVWEFPRIKSRHDANDRFAWIRTMCRQFEEHHPGVTVELTELTWQQGEDKLKIAVYAGAAPDITSGMLPLSFIQQGVVSPIDDSLTAADRADYFPGALSAFEWQGKHWGWPWCSKCDALFLNLELFRERGVAPPADGRWTMEQFLEVARRLTFDRNGDGAVDVYGLNFCFGLGRTAEYGLLLQPGGRFLSSGGTALAIAEEQAGLAGFRLLRSFPGRHAIAPPAAGGGSPKDVWLSFFERRSAAIIPCGLWALKALRARKPFPFALAHFPDGIDGRPRVLAVTTGFYVFRRPREPQREAMAHALARFLTSGPNQKIIRDYGQFPTRASAGDLYGDDEHMRRAAAICRFAEGLPSTPVWPQVDELLKRNLQLAVLGELPLEEATKRISTRARVLLTPPQVEAVESVQPAESTNLIIVAGVLVVLLLFFLVHVIRTKGPGRAISSHDERTAWFFLLPSVLVLGLFFAYPVFRATLLAFQQFKIGQGLWQNFVGLQHFWRLASDPVFRTALVNTIVYTSLVVPANLLTGLVLASLIAPLSARWRHVFRGAFYLPGVTSVVVLAMIWRWLYDVEYGVINGLLLHDREGAGWYLYQIVRNVLELPAQAPRFVCMAAVLFALTLLLRSRYCSWRMRKLSDRVLAGPGAQPGLLGRIIRGFDLAAGEQGILTFLFVTIGVIALVVCALAAVPWAPFAVKPVGWLTTSKLSLFSIILSMMIRGPGGALIIYLAALESCPAELYEVAEIDGASSFDSWWHITVPLLRPTTLFLLVTQTIGSFQVFAQVSLLTDGGPGTSSSVLVHRIYSAAFRDLDFGYASAQALVLFLIIAAISAVQFGLMNEDE